MTKRGNRLEHERSEKKDPRFNESLAKGLEILRAFEPRDGFLGNQDLASRTGLPKATVSRLTYTLTQLGYLSYSERLEKYHLGPSVLAIGYAFLSNLAIRQVAKPMMQTLADQVGTNVGLGERVRLEMIYLQHCVPAGPQNATTFRIDIGGRIPMATTAMGRAHLATLDDDEFEYFMKHLEKHHADNWTDLEDGIRRARQGYNEHGFCSSMGEWHRDANGIAVPLVINRRSIYVFNCSGPAYRIKPEYLEREVAPLLINTVRNVEAVLIRF